MKKFITIALLICASAFAQENVKLYPVHYADPSNVAAVITMMLTTTNGLRMDVTDRKLAVRGTAEQHAEVEQMLGELDAPPRNVQINVEFARSGQTTSHEAGIRPNGPIIIRDGEVHGSFQGRFSNQSTTSSENTTQMLVAMDGHSATLRVGERVPYLAWLTEYSWRHGYIREVQIEWQDVGSFLAVTPEIIGGGSLLRIRLTPTLSGRLKDGTEQTIRFTELTTEVVVRDGQTISIGGFSQDADFSSKFLVGRSGGSQSSITGITLTPHILP